MEDGEERSDCAFFTILYPPSSILVPVAACCLQTKRESDTRLLDKGKVRFILAPRLGRRRDTERRGPAGAARRAACKGAAAARWRIQRRRSRMAKRSKYSTALFEVITNARKPDKPLGRA